MANEKATSLVVRSSIVASLGGLLFGFDTAVISGTTEALRSVFNLNDWTLGLTVSSALFGTILGAATIQYPTNRYGRKPTLIMIAALYLISALGSAFPWNWSSFLFFRFIGGIGVGGASVVSPLYTAEIAPPKRRGFLVALTQFNIVLGILVAYISNFIIAGCHLGDAEWRWMFGVEAIPAFLFLVALFVNPESPRWLVTKNRIEEARKLFVKLVGSEEAADEELKVVQQAIDDERSVGKERLFCWRYRKLIMLAICIAAFNQLSGINAILYYAPKVFLLAGASDRMAMFFPTIIGLTNFIVTMLAIVVIDWFGRKTLMLVGSIGYILSLGLVGTLFTVFSDEFNAQIERTDGLYRVAWFWSRGVHLGLPQRNLSELRSSARSGAGVLYALDLERMRLRAFPAAPRSHRTVGDLLHVCWIHGSPTSLDDLHHAGNEAGSARRDAEASWNCEQVGFSYKRGILL